MNRHTLVSQKSKEFIDNFYNFSFKAMFCPDDPELLKDFNLEEEIKPYKNLEQSIEDKLATIGTTLANVDQGHTMIIKRIPFMEEELERLSEELVKFNIRLGQTLEREDLVDFERSTFEGMQVHIAGKYSHFQGSDITGDMHLAKGIVDKYAGVDLVDDLQALGDYLRISNELDMVDGQVVGVYSSLPGVLFTETELFYLSIPPAARDLDFLENGIDFEEVLGQ